MNYYDLIIITKSDIMIKKNYDYFITNQSFSLLDEHHLAINQTIYEFNYLIFSKEIEVEYPNNLILLENSIPVTNFYYQTSLENIYYINKENINHIINEIINE